MAEAISSILAVSPTALDDILVGIEEVPHLTSRWSGDRVPLSAALEGTKDAKAQIVLYERPIELRAPTPAELRELVHRTLVEQLSTLTGRSLDELGGSDFED